MIKEMLALNPNNRINALDLFQELIDNNLLLIKEEKAKIE